MLRKLCGRYLCYVNSHYWSLFRRHGDLFQRSCERDCGAKQTLSEHDINMRRLMYDAMMKKCGIKEYDNPYWWLEGQPPALNERR